MEMVSVRRRTSVYQVDAFTDVPFGGNPAGVVPEAESLDETHMQLIAREMALSETAFVLAPQRGGDLRLRFFTPQAEVALCGHATIGAFYLLADRDMLSGLGRTVRSSRSWRHLELVQETGAGDLTVAIRFGRTTGLVDRVMMQQAPPRRMSLHDPTLLESLQDILRAPPGTLGALGTPGNQPNHQPAPVEIWTTGLADLIVPVRSLAALYALCPDHSALAELTRGLGVTSVHAFTLETATAKGFAHARDFSPAVGIPEEAATGTASGAMGAYLVAHGLAPRPDEAGVSQMMFEQGHILGRPSTIYVEVTGEVGRPAEVRVGGRAVIMLEGTMWF
jgi:trans-2,3-dihydro-3-hydroxyanthranilate isomerase